MVSNTGTHIILFLLLSLVTGTMLHAQKGYRMDGEEVVFTFTKNDYRKATKDNSSKKVRFEDLTIESVNVSGEFNNWSKTGWNLERVTENTYELRKHVSDFKDEFSWDFKYVINNEYWAEPSRQDPNIAPALKDGRPLHVYNLRLYGAYPSVTGNATFKLKGYTDATRVIVAGSFNKWNEAVFEMNKTTNGWNLTLQVPPGVYEYKFIVDGKWIEDPNNPSKVRNEFNGYNSVLSIEKIVDFFLPGHVNARRVVLTGSFNEWSKDQLQMTRTVSGWRCEFKLPGGKHHYKFIVDGNWITDPGNSLVEYDGKGHVNSVYYVK